MMSNKIEYPITRINSSEWIDYEELFPIFDGYMYSSKEEIFRKYYYNKEFADCKGDVYRVIDRMLPTNYWRNLFSFLPGVYKVKLVFKKTGKRIALEELKEDLIRGIKKFDTADTKEEGVEWIAEIKNAGSIKEVLTGKLK